MKIIVAVVCLLAISDCGTGHAQPVSGFRGEIFGGLDTITLDPETPNIASSSGSSSPPGSRVIVIDEPLRKFNGVASSYGFGIGYDVPVRDRFSLGVDAELSGSSTTIHRGTVEKALAVPNDFYAFASVDSELSFGRDIYVGGRVTFPVSRTIFVHAKAGYANMRVTDTQRQIIRQFDSSLFGSPVATTRLGAATTSDRNIGGVRFGVGGQVQVHRRLYTMFEYRFTDYSDDITRNQVVAGVGLRF